MTAAVFAAECKLDQSLLQVVCSINSNNILIMQLQAPPPGDPLEVIITGHQDHMTHPAVVRQIVVPPVKRSKCLS